MYDLISEMADYPLWQSPPRRSLIICSHVRSGSMLLGEAVYGAGGLGCPLEYFHAGFRARFDERWNTNCLDAYKETVHRHRTDPSGMFSVKLFWPGVESIAAETAPERFEALRGIPAGKTPPETYRGLYQMLCGIFPNPTFVHLSRRNRIRQAVSLQLALATKVWWQFSDQEVALPETIYSYEHIMAKIIRISFCEGHWSAFFAANNIAPFRIVYEDFIRDYDGELGRLFAHLGCAAASIVPPRLKRQSNAQTEDLLAWFMKEHLRRTGRAERTSEPVAL